MTTPNVRTSARALAALVVALAALAATPAAAQQTVTVGEATCTGCDQTICPRANTIAIAAAQRYAVDAFTLSSPTPVTLNSVQVRVEPSWALPLIERIEIRSGDASMTTLYGTKVPAAALETIALATPIPVTASAATYKIAIVPKIHSAMPPPVSGAALGVRAYVSYLSTYEQGTFVSNGDGASSTVTIDNAGPADVTLTSITRADTSITFNWPAGNEVVFLRRLAGPVGDVPAEGATACTSTGTCDVKQGTTYGTSSSYVAFYGTTAAATFPDGISPYLPALTTNEPYYYRIFARDTCGNYSAGTEAGPIYPGLIAEGDTTNNTGKPIVGIINPAPGAAATPVRVQVRVSSPGGVAIATAADSIRVYADNGSTAAPVVYSGSGTVSVPTQFNLTRRTTYGTAADNGVYEYTPDAGTTWPGLPLAAGTWTLRAYGQNQLACAPTPTCREVYSGPVGLIVNAKGDGRLLVRDNSDQLCADCHATKTHSAESVGTGLGSWYVGCRACHQPHGTTNAGLVAMEIRPPALNQTLPPQKVSYLGRGSETTGDGKGLCQVCHTETTFFQRNVAGETHGDGQECATCHKHEKGQKTECTSCHGSTTRTPVAGADTLVLAAPPLSASPTEALRSLETEPSVGEHERHVNGSGTAATYTATPIGCDECHLGATHQNMVLGGGGDGLNVDMVWGPTATRNGASPLWNRVTCSNTYCHGATLVTFAGPPSGSNPNPSWISGLNGLTCTSCHASAPTMAQTGHPPNATCATCHGTGYTASALPANKSTHIDGTVQAPSSYCAKCHGDIAQTTVDISTNLNLAAPGMGTPASSYDTAGLAATTRGGTGTHVNHLTSTWSTPGGTASCGQCHDVPTNNLNRTHAQGGGTNGARATLTWGAIASGTADGWNSIGNAVSPATFTPPTPSYTGSNTQSGGTTGGTCSGVYCHGNFKNSGKTNVTISFTSTTALHCNSCHGQGSTAGNATTPPAPHPQVPDNCSGCHPGYSFTTVDPLTHVDGVLQANPQSTTCTDCHGDSTRVTKITTSDGFAGQVGRAAPPADARPPKSGTEQTVYVGAHQPHIEQANGTPLAAALNCTNCHTTIATTLSHSNNNPDIAVNSATGLGTGSSYTGANGATATEGSCSATYCHGNWRYGNGPTRVIQWGTGAYSAGTKLACSACHDALPAYPHPQNTTCNDCHSGYTASAVPATPTPHVNRATDKGSYGCSACHGALSTASPGVAWSTSPTNAAPGVAASSRDSAGNLDTATATGGIGAHKAHLAKTNFRTAAITCDQCHSVPATTNKSFADGGTSLSHALGDGAASRATLTWGSLSTTGGASPTYTGSSTKTTPAGAGGTCGSVYCHGNFTGGKTSATFGWSGSWDASITVCATFPCATTTMACTSCHGTGTFAYPAHPHPANGTCSSCHSGYTTTSLNATAKGTHISGAVNKTSYGCSACHGVVATASPGVASGTNPINAAPGAGGTGIDTTGVATAQAAGAHNVHLNNSKLRTTKVVCTDCHNGHIALVASSTDTTHATDLGTGGARAALGFSTFTTSDHKAVPGTLAVTYTGSLTGTGGTTAGTCNNTYCHGASSPNGANPLSGGSLKNPSWNSTAAQATSCSSCHGAPPPLKASGQAHSTDTACSGCHGSGYDAVAGTITGGALATHIDGQIQAAGGSCLGCHGQQQVGTVTRAQIVGLTTVSTTNADGDDFIRASRHVSNGTVNGTAIVKNVDCILCHAEGDAATSTEAVPAQSGLHGGANNKVDLRDVDSNGGSGVAASWPGQRKNTSVTKTAWDRDRMDWFCLGCHDGDGAAGISVNSTDTGFATSTAIVASNISRTTTAVTVTTAAAHGLVVGDAVNLTSAIPNAGGTATDYAPGVKTVATVPNTTSFTYNETGTALTSRAVTASFRRYIPSAAGQTSRTTTVVTVNTATAHGLVVGDVVALTPGEDSYRGGWKTVATVPTTTRFTYNESIATAPAASTRVQYFVKTSARANKPFNTADTLQNARETGTHSVRTWRATNNKVINVKSQFNSENLSGSQYAAHHNLNQFTKRYGTSNIATYVSAFLTKDNAVLSDTVGLHCADCHLNETNAHGARNTWYMLASSAAGTYSDYDVAPAGGGSTTSNDVCGRCHQQAVYAYTGGSGITGGAGSNHQRCTRLDDFNGQMRLGTPYTTSYGAATIPCLGCHGGNGATNLGPGLIHGTNELYAPNNTTVAGNKIRMYRFMGSGGTYRYYSPNNTQTPGTGTAWSTAGGGSCYNLAPGTVGADTWGACTNHTGDQTITTAARRGLDY